MSGKEPQNPVSKYPGSTSADLVYQAKDMDDDAWRRIVRLYSPLVYSWCQWAGLQESDRADVFQEVFAAAAKKIVAFRHDRTGDTFRGWLRVITQNKLRDFFRSRGNDPGGIGGSDAKNWLNGVEDATSRSRESQETDDTEKAALVRRALELIRDSFEPQTFQAFWRTAVDGQSAPEVAEELSVSPAAVRKAKSRVLQRLRSEFDGILS